MKTLSLSHIVPHSPPVFNGVGDYAYQLWRHWDDQKVSWKILSKSVNAKSREAWPQVQLFQFETNLPSLAQALTTSQTDVAVLHYVGFAYDKNGAPTWMPQALRQWKDSHKGKVVVMFHEVEAAAGGFLSRSFWSRKASLQTLRGLVGVADRWITSCPRNWEEILRYGRADPRMGSMVPVGSNIEEPAEVDWETPWPPDRKRPLRVVCFGGSSVRIKSLLAHRNLLLQLANMGQIESLSLVGAAPSSMDRERAKPALFDLNVPIHERYDLPSAEVSESLGKADLALIHRPYDILHKSGSYAAAARHGLWVAVPHGQVPADAAVLVPDPLGNIPPSEFARVGPLRKAASEALDWCVIAEAWRQVCEF